MSSRFHPLPNTPPATSRFHNLSERLRADEPGRSSSRVAAYRAAMAKRDETPSPRVAAILGNATKSETSKPKTARPASPPPPPPASVAFAPPPPTRAEIEAAKVRLQQEADAAKAAEVQRRQAAADAVWERAHARNNFAYDASNTMATPGTMPKHAASNSAPPLNRSSATTLSAERQAAADAVWARAQASIDRDKVARI